VLFLRQERACSWILWEIAYGRPKDNIMENVHFGSSKKTHLKENDKSKGTSTEEETDQFLNVIIYLKEIILITI
jgi:uncharacterized protein YpiB (UPF0302 family)